MAARFDADTDFYTATTGLPGSTYTVTCWAYITVDRNDYSPAFTIYDGTNTLYLETGTDGVTWEVDSNASGVGAYVATVGTWSRLGMVVTGTSVTFYGGAATGALSTATATITDVPATPTGLTIGGDTSPSSINGRVGSLKVHSAALTAAEVVLELAQYVPVRAANLLRFHPFIGAETTDRSGNGNNLTAGSTATSTEDGPPIPWRVAVGPQIPTAGRRAANY